MRYLFITVFLFPIFISCGYKPTTFYTKKFFDNRIYTHVDISLEDPENTVLIKDALNEAVVSEIGSNISNEKDADSKIYVKLNSVRFVPIQYDRHGYVIAYKAYVGLKSKFVDTNGKVSYIKTKGDYDFPIKSNSLISDRKRFEAIKFASKKALDELRSIVSMRYIK